MEVKIKILVTGGAGFLGYHIVNNFFKKGIEEIDILDLEKYIAQTDHADIQLVYENLLKGSQNHLRAFVSTLQRQTGETYQPQYLSQDVYDAIVGSAIERGGNRSGNGNRGN